MPEIRDPLYGDIIIKETELEILDTREFQRLRGLHQLPASHFVFPGATHSRFSHSIGVMELATRIVKNIEREIPQKEVDCLRIAALLHDIEEPPFYPVFKENYPMKQILLKTRDKLIEKICRQINGKVDLDKTGQNINRWSLCCYHHMDTSGARHLRNSSYVGFYIFSCNNH